MSEGDLIWKLLLIASTIGNIVMAWVMFRGRNGTTTIEGRVNVNKDEQFVTRDHHDMSINNVWTRIRENHDECRKGVEALDKDITTLGQKIEKTKDDLSIEGSRRSSQLNKRLDEIAKETTKAATTAEITGNQFAELAREVRQAVRSNS